jgi:hexosaminidase
LQLNVFHWHIVDTHSFPLEFKQDPINKMSQYGAYDGTKIYTQNIIKDIVKHATFRGLFLL